MLACRQVGKGGGADLLKRCPLTVVQAIGVKQPLAGGVFPLVLAPKCKCDRAALMEVFILLGQAFNLRLRRVAIRLRIIQAQAMGRARPKTAALILVETSHRSARQSFFNSVFNPRPLRESMQATVGSYPDAAEAMCSNKRIDSVEAEANLRAVADIELPDSICSRAPRLTVPQFHKGNRVIRVASALR